jgi:ABC-type glycerol-3-phosphate transport system permease component
VAYVIVALGALWTLLPLYLMLITAFKSWQEMHAVPPTWFPQQPTLVGFQEAIRQGGKGIIDSAIVAIGTLVVSLLLGVPAGYSFSRFNTGGRGFALALLGFRFLPPIALSAAVYLIAVRLHIVDTHLLLILVNCLFGIPLVAWLMKGFFDEIPYAIEEAAHMDGASWTRAVRDHVLPLVMPGLVAVSLFVAIFTWNELVFATILTADDVVPFTRVVPGLWVGRKYLLQPNWPAISALGIMNLGVVILLGFFLQRYIVRTMSYGAVSGATWGE